MTGKKLSGRDRVVFALLLMGFFALLGFIAMTRPRALWLAAGLTTLAWLASLAFNRALKLKAQLTGLLIPGVLGLIYGIAQMEPGGGMLAPALVWTLGAAIAGGAFIASTLGQRIYDVWMTAAVPIGWSFSMLILGTVYYLVLTPVGLLMRLLGYDPMHRRFDRGASTYWIRHEPASDSQRYFRQF